MRQQTHERHVRFKPGKSRLRTGLIGIALLAIAAVALIWLFTVMAHDWTHRPQGEITRRG
jgi:hypothetical protein